MNEPPRRSPTYHREHDLIWGHPEDEEQPPTKPFVRCRRCGALGLPSDVKRRSCREVPR